MTTPFHKIVYAALDAFAPGAAALYGVTAASAAAPGPLTRPDVAAAPPTSGTHTHITRPDVAAAPPTSGTHTHITRPDVAAAPPTSGTHTHITRPDVAAAPPTSGTHIQMYDGNGTAAQAWPVGNSDNSIKAPGSGQDVTSGANPAGNTSAARCRAAAGPSGTKIELYDCNSPGAERWTPSNGTPS